MMPMVHLEVSPIPAGTSPDDYQRRMDMAMTVQRVSTFFSPAIVALILALQALVVFAACSVLTIDVKFRWPFNVVAGCSLIQVLASIASLAILKGKGEISMLAELRPLSASTSFCPRAQTDMRRFFLLLFGFRDLVDVMMVLVFSVAFRVSKAKAFAAILPLIAVSILLRIGAAVVQR